MTNDVGALTNGGCAFIAEALWGLCALLPYEDRVRKCDLGEHICSELQFESLAHNDGEAEVLEWEDLLRTECAVLFVRSLQVWKAEMGLGAKLGHNPQGSPPVADSLQLDSTSQSFHLLPKQHH